MCIYINRPSYLVEQFTFCINEDLPDRTLASYFCGKKRYELYLYWTTSYSSRNLIYLHLFSIQPEGQNPSSPLVLCQDSTQPAWIVSVRLRSCLSFPWKRSRQLSHRGVLLFPTGFCTTTGATDLPKLPWIEWPLFRSTKLADLISTLTPLKWTISQWVTMTRVSCHSASDLVTTL